MATLRQIAANLINAQMSTGPITDAGKDASRRNSLKHGLAGAGAVLPDDDLDAIEQRKIEWRPSYLIETAGDEWFFEQAILHSIRLDRCREQEAAIYLNESQRATLFWNEDRQLEAEEIAAKLAKHPGPVSRRLQHTKQGVEWMIARWQALGKLHERNGEWTEAQTSLVLDLLGTPLELRDDPPIENPASLVAREIACLERRKVQALDALDEFERAAVEKGIPVANSRAITNLRRYEAACLRNFHGALNKLRLKPQNPVPPPPPAPTPEPEDDEEILDLPDFPEAPRPQAPAPTVHSMGLGNRRARRAAAKQARRRSA